MTRYQLIRFAIFVAIPLFSPTTKSCFAQSIESDPAPARGQFTAPESTEPAPEYLIPDVPPQLSQQLKVDRHWLSLTPGLVLIGDYNAFGQDASSLSQVGKQIDQFDDRAVRFMARGKVGGVY